MVVDDTNPTKDGAIGTDTGTGATATRIYPSSPLEESVTHSTNANGNNNNNGGDEQRQSLLPPAPPSYDQATNAPPIAKPAMTTGAGAGVAPISGAHVVVITPGAPVIYGPEPVDIQCPYCHNFTRTRLRYKPTSRTHLIALLLCLFQLYCFICLPYCIGSCMNVAHYCGMCDRYLGTYTRS